MTRRLQEHLAALVGERHPFSTPEALRRAEAYLAEQFRGLGLAVCFHDFDALGGTYRNVIAELPGATSDAGPPLIVAAHYDTVPGSPGADDNASGLAVLLEAARSLAAPPPAAPVRFIAFCLEEENLLGSLAYAAALRERGEPLRGAIVLECVGFARPEEGTQQVPPGVPIAVPSAGDFLVVVGNAASAGLVAAIEGAARRDVPNLKTVPLVVPGQGDLLPDTRRSDHAAFWQYGYPAVMLTDTANFRNPHYHQPTDTLDTLDLSFIERVTRLVVAAARNMPETDRG
ncbi:M20/M25/M40 family metallo-hydrolase [Nitrospira sp. Kam-Ns4a]